MGQVAPAVTTNGGGRVFLAIDNLVRCVSSLTGDPCDGYTPTVLSTVTPPSGDQSGRVYARCPLAPLVIKDSPNASTRSVGIGSGKDGKVSDDAITLGVICRAAGGGVDLHIVDGMTGAVQATVGFGDGCTADQTSITAARPVFDAGSGKVFAPIRGQDGSGVVRVCAVNVGASPPAAEPPIPVAGCDHSSVGDIPASVVTDSGLFVMGCASLGLDTGIWDWKIAAVDPATGKSRLSVSLGITSPGGVATPRLFALPGGGTSNIVIAGKDPSDSKQFKIYAFDAKVSSTSGDLVLSMDWTAMLGTDSAGWVNLYGLPVATFGGDSAPDNRGWLIATTTSTDDPAWAISVSDGKVTAFEGLGGIGNVADVSFIGIGNGGATDERVEGVSTTTTATATATPVGYSGGMGVTAFDLTNLRSSWSLSTSPDGKTIVPGNTLPSYVVPLIDARQQTGGKTGQQNGVEYGAILYVATQTYPTSATLLTAVTSVTVPDCSTAGDSCKACTTKAPAGRQCGYCKSEKKCVSVSAVGIFEPVDPNCRDTSVITDELICPTNFADDALMWGLIAGGSAAFVSAAVGLAIYFRNRRRMGAGVYVPMPGPARGYNNAPIQP